MRRKRDFSQLQLDAQLELELDLLFEDDDDELDEELDELLDFDPYDCERDRDLRLELASAAPLTPPSNT